MSQSDDEYLDSLMRRLADELGMSPEELDGAELNDEMLSKISDGLRKEIVAAIMSRITGTLSDFEAFARSDHVQAEYAKFEEDYGHLSDKEKGLIISSQVAASLDSEKDIDMHLLNRSAMMWTWLTELCERMVTIAGSTEVIEMLLSAATHIEENLRTGEIEVLTEAEDLYQTQLEAIEARRIELAVVGDSGSSTGLDDAPGFYL
jgi:hypothetical protein